MRVCVMTGLEASPKRPRRLIRLNLFFRRPVTLEAGQQSDEPAVLRALILQGTRLGLLSYAWLSLIVERRYN